MNSRMNKYDTQRTHLEKVAMVLLSQRVVGHSALEYYVMPPSLDVASSLSKRYLLFATN